CENIFELFLNLYTPRVSAIKSLSDLRWLTPLLTMGSFFGPKYGFWPDYFPRMGRRTQWFNMMGLTGTRAQAKLECKV
ncbi:hypothetical protein QUA43_27840, partial [Microcoleus sp. N9_B4]|uniref:hypothetical protein n=1 Tax=Microcoleus sp. N9_B4 TaxID=3055386 RepID=UPI002FD6825F